jgi:hypothetical protein
MAQKVVKTKEQIVAESLPVLRVSKSRLKEGDASEVAAFLYQINPLKFQRIAAAQGVAIESIEDAQNLFVSVAAGLDPFNVKRFLRTIRFTSKEIAGAGKRIEAIG